MSKYNYSDSERDMLKVLKMQEDDLKDLSSKIDNDSEDLVQIRKQLEARMLSMGIDPSSVNIENRPIESDGKLNKEDIPSWESLVDKANEKYSEDVIIEDLLNKEEIQYCIDEVERINNEFESKTGIFNVKDMSFLIVATALQTARWLIIQKVCGDLGQKIDADRRLEHNDKSIKDNVSNSNKKFQGQHESHGHRESLKGYKSWEQIIFSSAPYDTTVNSMNFGENLEGRYHRYKTLGHDPILGWIFGTANFITDTCTLSNFHSYRISRVGTPHFAEPTNLPEIFYEVFDSIREDWLRLPAAVFAQYVHLKSDEYTKLGLPVPMLEVFSEKLAGNLYRSQYDSLCLLRDLKIVGNQALWSILINMLVSLIHGMLYDPKKDGDQKLYEVRTRKILCISNSLASAGNIAYCVCCKDLKKLDVGGILVTLYRLFTDIRFITKMKEEYIKKEMDKVLEEEIKEIDSHFNYD